MSENSRHDGDRRRIEPDDPPAVLLDLDEKDFYNLVDRDVRGRLDQSLARKLRDPMVNERWYQTLLRMKKTVEGQIAAKSTETKGQRAELEANGTITTWRGNDIVNVESFDDPKAKALELYTQFMAWKSGSVRFKVGVEERFTEVAWRRKRITANLLLSVAQVERNLLADEVIRLRDAIARHQDVIHEDDATEQDEELWSALDGLDEVSAVPPPRSLPGNSVLAS